MPVVNVSGSGCTPTSSAEFTSPTTAKPRQRDEQRQ
jgi:hypothetical protein